MEKIYAELNAVLSVALIYILVLALYLVADLEQVVCAQVPI